ncbi:run domain Beclin-1-interacting and cysteine-rich domain-containing protein [Tetranychus urticae]|uniref:Rubicon Homology domain-containing protein n=1 Tax=Tetranychus urticae TaxID=32264 RepID=T1L3P9_TETUR|nr:run domain Beclin-1-interacting and cysteine-rich domain-containing protein [Tetranychus urticae]
MSSDSENQSSFLLLLLKHLNQTNSDSLETLERENLHFVITDNLIATFEEIKCDIFFNKHHSQIQHQQISPKSSCNVNTDKVITNHLTEDTSASPTPTPSSDSSSVPSSYQDGTVLSSADWLVEQSNSGSDVFSNSGAADKPDNFKLNISKHESELNSFSGSISNLSEISSNVTLDGESKVLSETSTFGPLDDFESADNSAESVAVQLLSHYSQRPFSTRRSSLQPFMMSSPMSGDEPNRNSSRSLPIRRSGSSCYSLYSNPSPIVTNTSFQSLSSLHQVPSAATRSSSIKLRGNSLWAPLRPQLICNIQRPTDKYSQWQRQNQRCAGCGFNIDSKCKEFHGIMYCYYTGKFFCRVGCHSGRKAILPAYVIHNWDFNCYPLSNCAVNFLEKYRGEPLFHINDLNPSLYKRVKQLSKLLDLRFQLRSLREYISTCRNAKDFVFYFKSFEPQHFIQDDIHLYSLEDLITIKRSKKLLDKCWALVRESIDHVSRCEYCKARGFFCELCKKEDVLFPFEIGRIYQCSACHSCFHLYCFNHQANQKCSKCSRIQARRSRHQPTKFNNSDTVILVMIVFKKFPNP